MRCTKLAGSRDRVLKAAVVGIGSLAALTLGGCKSWIDPSEVVRDKGERLVVPILSSIDPLDESETGFAAAQEVRPQDLKVVAKDYVIGRNDLITVSIFDLINGGVETVRTARVSETGMLSLPMLPEPVKAAALTEQQLQRAIAAKYKEAGILERAQVSVTVVEARQRTFSILGAVARPGQYSMVESDFRLLNALVLAGDVANPLVEELYIVRRIESETPSAAPATEDTGGGEAAPAPKPAAGEDPLAPRSSAGQEPPAATQGPADEKLVRIEGQVVGVGGATTQPAGGAAAAQGSYEFGANAAAEERVIRIPLQQLRNGDLRYNVVVRPNDTIMVALPNTGFYYVGGHVNAPGVYALSGQKVTLKQALIGARMADALAVPSKTDIIRRVGNNEIFVRVDLTKVFEGRQPDLFLKPNDQILVGTDFYPPFLAALRGAFRATYGFGFLYDRNYAPRQDVVE